MMHAESRVFAAGLLAAAALLATTAALADDGGSDATATSTSDDAATGPDAAHGCAALGEPCAKGQVCCEPSAYCGAFSGTGQSLVCGVNTRNSLPTSSCSIGTPGGSNAVLLVGAIGAATFARRRRRAHTKRA